MNRLLNWRQWVLYALLAVGFFAIMAIFGDDERALSEWIEARVYLAAIAVTCFYSLWRLTKKWEREGKIPEFTNPKIK